MFYIDSKFLLLTILPAGIILASVLAYFIIRKLALRAEGNGKEIKPKFKKIAVALLISVVALSCVAIGFAPFADNLKAFKFESAPAVFDAGDRYAVIWATSKDASSAVEIKTASGETITVKDDTVGIGNFFKRIHRVDIDKSLLDTLGNSYRVISRETLKKGSNYYYDFGKELKSKSYSFKPVNDSENLAFFVISDIQGGEKALAKTIARVDENYDFVLMLGDYNDKQASYNDIIKSIIVPASLASRGEIPCVFLLGNHELKGALSKEVQRIFPTPSLSGEQYFTYSYGQLFLTGLFLGDNHNDNFHRYSGESNFEAYRDKQHLWLESVLLAEEYKNYTYNIGASHIPLISATGLLLQNQTCHECKLTHGYKAEDFQKTFSEMGILMLVSAHSHFVTLAENEACAFPNLHTGGVNKMKRSFYQTTLVKLSGGDSYEFITYTSRGDKTVWVEN
ncbi:MAG: metallophosphoesterase [Firmicutes bacterium]|nr:metallophosphoesterase [Bacillota bacterium]